MELEDPLGYLALVNTFLGNESGTDVESALRRTIISRLYYGVFHHIKLKLFGINNDKPITHQKLKAAAQKFVDKNGININIKDHLSELEKKREIADYKRFPVIDEKFLNDTLTIFKIVKKDCEKIWGH